MQKLLAKYNTPERQHDALAVGILEDIGTPEARQILSKLAKGAPGVGVTTAAKAASTTSRPPPRSGLSKLPPNSCGRISAATTLPGRSAPSARWPRLLHSPWRWCASN